MDTAAKIATIFISFGMLIYSAVVVGRSDPVIDVPVTITYWAERTSVNFSGRVDTKQIMGSPLPATIMIPVIVNFLVNLSTLGNWPMLRYVDEFMFCAFMNINVALVVGMNDFGQLYNLAILSLIPTMIVYLAETDAYRDLKLGEKVTRPFRRTVKVCCLEKDTNYGFAMFLSFMFTFLIYVAIIVVHHCATDPRAITHAAVYVVLISQLIWRSVMIYIHVKDTSKKSHPIERAWAVIAVTVCTVLIIQAAI